MSDQVLLGRATEPSTGGRCNNEVGGSTSRDRYCYVATLGRSGIASFWPSTRVRRPSDVGRLLLAVSASLVLGLLAVVAPAFVRSAGHVASDVRGLPRLLLAGANVVTSLALLGVLLAVAVDAIRARRHVLISGAVACGLALLAGFALQEVTGLAAGSALPALLGERQHSALLPVAAAVGLLVGVDLQRRHRWTFPAQLALSASIVCSLALRSLTGPSALSALLLGATAGLAVRVAVGVVPARPSMAAIRSVMARAGWEVSGLRPLDQAAGQVRYDGTGPEGVRLRLTVVDSDRRGVTLARRAWRLLRLRAAAAGRPALSLRGQLERQALSSALAQSAGVGTPRVLALLPAGSALVLVEEPVGGTPLSDAAAPAAAHGAVAAAAALLRLHDAGLALGALGPDGVVLLPGGTAGFVDLSAAQPAATDLQRELDVVALLVAVASHANARPAVEALRSAYGTSPASEARLVALLRPVALPRAARLAVRGTPLLAELRAVLSSPGTAGAVPPLRLERLRIRTVVMVAGATVAAHILATQLSKVSVGSALQQAEPGWLAVALAGSALTYLGAALALVAFVPVALPLARTALVQLASSFLTLVTPPTVGHVGLNIRYLQRAGLPVAAAAASVAVSQAVTVTVTVTVLLLCGWLSGVSASRPALLPSGGVLVVLLVAAAALALVASAPPTRRLLRARLEPLVRRTLPQLLASTSDPRRLVTALLGVLILNGGNILALDASLRAFSASLAVPALVVVYLAGSTIGSVAPTPGGLGAVEAALVGGLTTTGVPVAQALAAVLAFRVVTFWLPAPVGWLAFVALQRRARI